VKNLKLHILAILFMLPFLGGDLYSKYLAYQHFTEESDQLVINDYVYAGLPLRNYGWIGSEFPVEVNSFTNISGNIIRPLICVFIYCLLFSLDTFWLRLNCGMLAGGAWGNGLESVLFRGGTDFLYIRNTGTFLDMFVANLADVFIFLALILFALFPLASSLLERLFYRRYVATSIHRKRFRYGKKKRAEVVARYKRGETLEDIAEFAETSVPSVRGVLVHAGVYGDENITRQNLIFAIKPGDEKYSDLREVLSTTEYSRTVRTDFEGSYSIRGDTIDIWKYNDDHPIRYSFFGETLEDVFPFDPVLGKRIS
jgi:lipoprotein signal peptidase